LCPKPAQYLLKPNDLVFARTGATTGKSFLIHDCPEAIFASYLIRLRVKRLVPIDYLYRYFQTSSYWAQIAGEKSGSAQPNLNGTKLASLRVPIAPPEEQQRIVAYLDGLQAKADSVSRLQGASATELDALLPAMLNKAFKGEL
jgi:type I restriction enzyme S subunit